jgi:signal peptidase I
MTASTTAAKKRSRVLAFLLNFVAYPAGYVYVGRTRLGLTVYLTISVLAVAAFILSINFPPGVYALTRNVAPAYGAIILLNVAFSFHAAFLAGDGRDRLKGDRFWAAIIGLPLAAFAISFFLGPRYWPYPPYSIPSASNVPTLQEGDMVVASGSKTNCGAIDPKLGDVVVFRHKDTSYIKRLLGLPGDRVQFRNGLLLINDRPAAQTVEGNTTLNLGGFSTKADLVRETLPNGRSYSIALVDRTSPAENTPVFTLPAGQYFMVGDSRDNSLDSRFPKESDGIGFVPADSLCGVAVKIVYSSNPAHIGTVP